MRVQDVYPSVLRRKAAEKGVHLAEHIRLIREEYIMIRERQANDPRGAHIGFKRAIYLRQLLQTRKHRADFRGLLHFASAR